MNEQLSLFDFEELHPPKKETEIKPFFLVTYGLTYDRLKFGTSKENINMLTRQFDTIEEVMNGKFIKIILCIFFNFFYTKI